MNKKRMGIIRLYCGAAGELSYYNLQELGLAKEYAKHGYEVYIIILKKGNLKKKIQYVDKNIIFIFPVTLNMANHGVFSVKIINELGLDLIHLNSDNQFYVPIVLNYCQKNGVEVYNYVGTLYSSSSNKLKKFLANITSKINMLYYDRFLTIAKTVSAKNQLENHGLKNVGLVPVGLDVEGILINDKPKEILRKELNIPVHKKIILFIGRMEEEKRPLVMIDLLNILDDNFFLVMIGDGRQTSEVNNKIKELGLNNRVYRILKIENKEIYKYYRCADFFINLCDSELFGMCILEAMYNRCVVIAMRSPGADMLIRDNETGFLVNNIDDIKTLLNVNLCNNKQVLQQAYDNICENYLWEKNYEKIEELRKARYYENTN